MRHGLKWFIHLRAQRPRVGDEHPAYTPQLQHGSLYLYQHSLTAWLRYPVKCKFSQSACSCEPDSWIVVAVEGRNEAVANMTDRQRYVIAMYFAVVTMTTTGYGDIGGHCTRGFIAVIVTVAFGMIVFAYALSVLAATLANSDAPKYATHELKWRVV